jgi:hypothetical protein
MSIHASIRDRLYARLRREPSPSSVPGSLPVLFFGDLLTARVVTVGLNPSRQEYLDRSGRELDGAQRRFETLRSLGVAARCHLTDEQCDRAMQRMREFYRPGKPIYWWFRSLDRVTRAMGLQYERGEVAHLDLVQEATDPTWSSLEQTRSVEAQALRSADLPFLRWQVETFPLRAVVCDGRTVFDKVCRLLGGRTVQIGTQALVTWYEEVASIHGRSIGLAGWNRPLNRPTGLGADGEQELGYLLAAHLAGLGALPVG